MCRSIVFVRPGHATEDAREDVPRPGGRPAQDAGENKRTSKDTQVLEEALLRLSRELIGKREAEQRGAEEERKRQENAKRRHKELLTLYQRLEAHQGELVIRLEELGSELAALREQTEGMGRSVTGKEEVMALYERIEQHQGNGDTRLEELGSGLAALREQVERMSRSLAGRDEFASLYGRIEEHQGELGTRLKEVGGELAAFREQAESMIRSLAGKVEVLGKAPAKAGDKGHNMESNERRKKKREGASGQVDARPSAKEDDPRQYWHEEIGAGLTRREFYLMKENIARATRTAALITGSLFLLSFFVKILLPANGFLFSVSAFWFLVSLAFLYCKLVYTNFKLARALEKKAVLWGAVSIFFVPAIAIYLWFMHRPP